MSRAWIAATFAALCATMLIFRLWPGVDIAFAENFFIGGGFFGASPWARAYRYFFYALPIAVMIYAMLAYGLRQRGLPLPCSAWVSARGLVFMALSMAIGPGAIVNLGLKDHWHRPRPIQIAEFGGSMEFRPIWRGDGECKTNCSFVSGEVSTEAWLLAPASLAPPPLRPLAMALALAATLLTALGRMAFGGHFLSDTILAALLTALVVQACRRWLFGGKPAP